MQPGGLLMCLLTFAVVSSSSSAWAAPVTATPSPRLDEQGFWKAWLLYEEPQEGGRRKGQIQPKSIFIAPVIKDLPDCAPGYQADALGRCNKLVKVNQNAQLGFLLQKLNAMYANSEKFTAFKKPTTTEGPLQFVIPFAEAPRPNETVLTSTTTTTSTTVPPSTMTTDLPEEEVTELAEVMVVAAQVELQDETKSTSLPGAIVTLWHLNETTLTTTSQPEEMTETETVALTDMTTTLPADVEETTQPPAEVLDTEVTTMPAEDVDTTFMTTTPADLEVATTITTPKTQVNSRPAQKIISKPVDPDPSVVEAEFYPEEEEVEEPLETKPPTLPPQTPPTSPVVFNRPYPDAVVFERPSQGGEAVLTDLTGDNSNPTLQWGPPLAKLEAKPVVPSESRIVFPSSDNQPLLRKGGVQSTASWSWGNWEHTTSRPLLLNFYSQLPQVSQNPGGGVRTHLSHPSVYPTSGGRHTPLFYQELTGHDVANVLGRPWRHHRNHY